MDDCIINECIKSTSGLFIELYEKWFNVIFRTCVILDIWLIGYIKPINKTKVGSPKYVDLLLWVSAIFNERLNLFSENFMILNKRQCGFRKCYSTIDNVYVTRTLFEVLKLKRKNKKVWRIRRFRKGVWHDLARRAVV